MVVAIDPTLYHDNKLSTKKMMDDFYSYSIPQLQSYQTQAHIDRKFALGDQRTLAGTYGEYYENQKFVFNILHAQRQMILGHQAKNRKSSIVVPREDRDQETADDYSKCLVWTMGADEMLQRITEAFDCSLVTGLCFMHRWIDYSRDPTDGVVRIRNYAPTTVMFDPWWRQRDLSDCRYIWTRDFVSEKQLEQMLPDFDKVKSMIPKNFAIATRFNFMPENYRVMARKKGSYAYDQFFYSTDRDATLIHSYDRAETYEVKGDKATRDKWIELTFSQEERENLEVYKTKLPCIHLAIAVNDRVIYDEYHSEKMPFTPMLAYFDPDSPNYSYRFQGIIRPARDTQYLFNRRMQTQLQILESLPTSGINVVEDALIDKNDAFKTGPGQVRVVKKNYIPGQVISDIHPPQIDASALKMTDDLNMLSKSILGISEELMGMADDSKAGITEILRQGASLTTLQTLFDNLDYSQKMLSQGLLEEISLYTPSKVRRIIGREPTPEFFNLNWQKFGCEIEDGLNTGTQKKMEFAQALALLKEGVPISPQQLLKASTLQNKKEYIDDVEKQQQQQQAMEKQKMDAELMAGQANMKLLQSQGNANDAMAEERRSRIDENEMMAIERRAKSISDLQDAQLKKVEALKKLDELDLAHIEKLVNILNTIQQMNTQNAPEATNGIPQ